jgi:hypothetical protein
LPRLTALLPSVGLSISKREIQRQLIENEDGFLDEPSFACSVAAMWCARGGNIAWVSVNDTHARTAQSQERLLHKNRNPQRHRTRLS